MISTAKVRNTNLIVYAIRRIALNQEIENKFKGEDGVRFHSIKRVQVKNLLSYIIIHHQNSALNIQYEPKYLVTHLH